MQANWPLVKDLALVGGGHAHALLLRRWAMRPLPGVRVTLINPEPAAPYTGMLPGHVAGHYALDDLQIDLVKLARHAGARLVIGAADGIDRKAKTVTVPGRPPIAYDVLSLDVGVGGAVAGIAGSDDHGVPAKPLDRFAARWSAFLADPPQRPRVLVIGGGAAGCELALAMAHRLKTGGRPARVTLVEAGPVLAPELSERARGRLAEALDGYGIAVRLDSPVEKLEAGCATLAGGDRGQADFIAIAAGARPWNWLDETGLALHYGYVAVDRHLRSLNDPDVFAAGDCAHLTHAPRPKAGVFAVRAAPVLHANLAATLSGGRLCAFQPQRDWLRLVSTGAKTAIADKARLAISGGWVWRWKDFIDRRFMTKLTDLRPMRAPRPPRRAALGLREELGDGEPLCGGCGSKAGQAGLKAGLAALPAPRRADLVTGAGDDAAVIRTADGYQVMTTDHVKAVTEDPWLMGRIAAVHALGDVQAMGADPQAALATIILERMSERLQARTLAEIMDAAGSVFAAAGADIAGGHTSLGAETTLGFTVTGLSADPPLTLAGAKPGDALIVTRPIGSGVILAGEMRLRAKGREAAMLLEALARDQVQAARILKPAAAAMTDVTGFGLAGHLLGMLDASGAGAEIALESVPLHAGALGLAEAGVRSTLWASNHAASGPRVQGGSGAMRDLLFDPQTAGGFLAALPADQADDGLARLRAAGERAAIIGRVVEGPAAIALV